VILAWLLAVAHAEPSDQTLVYYNARLALREDEPLEAVKLWLLRNAIEDGTGLVSKHDGDFVSITWAALGELGVCQDGLETDEDGVGLWPVALHNWIVRNAGRSKPPKRPRPFAALEIGRQQRFVSVTDVLSARELAEVELFRGPCARPRLALIGMGATLEAKLSDREVATKLLRFLLERSRHTLDRARVQGWATIEARLFDIDLQLTALAAREARQEAREKARRGRQLGLSSASVAAMDDDADSHTLAGGSEAAHVLRASVEWPVSEWLTLSPERRLFLFDHARAYTGDEAALEAIALGIVDELVARGEGDALEAWIARTGPPEVLWGGERGQRLLSLDAEAGFQERAVIALHRGLDQLGRGELNAALRSLSFALRLAPESKQADVLHALSLRWLSYVTSQFRITDELLVTLQALVPPREYAVILEDLLWRATFHADVASFEHGVRNQQGRGALARRAELLAPLAAGDVGGFSRGVRDGLARSPSETLRLLDQLVQRLELEDAEVRAAQAPTLRAIRGLVTPLTTGEGSGRQARIASDLLDRVAAILDGVGALGADATERDRARALAPDSEVFAGAVRLAPADPVPWPFFAAEASAPSVFAPIELTPVEWRDDDGRRVFGWRMDG
jgi:hypothetical protein